MADALAVAIAEPARVAEQYLEHHEDRVLGELLEFLRIPSVAVVPEHQADRERAAAWIAARLHAAGVSDIELLPPPDGGPPVVYGRIERGADLPTVLIYGHYDTQTPNPVEEWDTPPFEPTIRDGAIYARGASDDKGMLVAAFAAIEALLETDTFPDLNLIFCIEGAEESFSTGLADLIRSDRARFACDMVVSADGTMVDRERLSLTVSTKGVCALAVQVQTAATDLHSGVYGATIPNAAQVLTRLVATLHDAEGRVAVDGFYDAVRELTPEERVDLNDPGFDADAFLADVGATAFWGEPGYTPAERVGARPTIDLVGISGGPGGDHIHAITPGRATAKFSCRLVPDQDPEQILALIQRHFERHCPEGATLTFRTMPGIYPFAIDRDHPGLVAAREVMQQMTGHEPMVWRTGGALPMAAVFQRELGADMVFFAWDMPDANIHAPNERLRLDDFWACAQGYCRYLSRLASALTLDRDAQ